MLITDTNSFVCDQFHIKHAAPSIRLRHHHGLFEFQNHTTSIHDHMAPILHDESVYCVQSCFNCFQRSNTYLYTHKKLYENY